jgi:hypothetical protein
MHLLSQIIYSFKTLYMFRTVFSSIIRSSKLRKQLLLPAAIGEEMVAGSSSCLTYTYCCIRSFELLMMDEKTVRNMYSVLQE